MVGTIDYTGTPGFINGKNKINSNKSTLYRLWTDTK
jgi:hypothetical protein